MKNLVLSILLSYHLCVDAQKSSIVFTSRHHDWGDMISTQFPPAAFVFTNRGTRPAAILTARSEPQVKVTYDRVYVAPGDSGIIYVKYESNQTGKFEEKIEVLFNTEPTSFQLTVSGNNVSVLSCQPDPKNLKNREVRVIDAVTKQPIKNAWCSFFSYNKPSPNQFTCDNKGSKHVELPIGMYDISIKAPGYIHYQNTSMVPKSAPILFYELERSPAFETLSMTTTQQTATPPKPPIETRKPLIQRDTSSIQAKKPTDTNTLKGGNFLPNNIILLIDISNSMNTNNKLKRLKASVKKLVSALRPQDSVSVITYNYKSYVNIEAVSGAEEHRLCLVIDSLRATGLTDGVKGIENAFEIAHKHFIKGGNNQLILATDGEFVGGQMTDDKIMELVRHNFANKVLFSIVSFGVMPDAVGRMKKLAQAGGGSCIQIDNETDDANSLLDEIKQKSAFN